MPSFRTTMLISVTVLAVIAVFCVLSLAKNVFAPVLAAILLGIVLSPLSDLWDKLRVPIAISSFLSVALALCLLLLLMILMEPYITQLIRRAPVIWIELRDMVDTIQAMLRGLEEMSKNVSEAIEGSTPAVVADQAENEDVIPSVTDALFYAPAFAAQLLTFIGTLYFTLLARHEIYGWVNRVRLPIDESDLRFAGSQVARYFLTISGINATFGILIALVMSFIGMPNPILWGLLAWLVNYVLYLGPVCLGAALFVAGIVIFDGPASFLPPAMYLSMNAVEGQFVTPSLVGKSLSVNPLFVFLALVFWLWLWGPIGGIIAIPLTIWVIAVYKRMQHRSQIEEGGRPLLHP